jgi:hypothetical protein
LTRFSKQACFCGFRMKSIRQKRQICSKGLVNPQIAPSGFECSTTSSDYWQITKEAQNLLEGLEFSMQKRALPFHVERRDRYA